MSITVYYLKTLLPAIEKAARRHGYAIGVHGSMVRDFDVMAMPWIETASPPDVLIQAVKDEVGGYLVTDGTEGGRWDKEQQKFVKAIVRNPDHKPHGRVAWNIHINGEVYIDISVMPLRTENA